jgi:hypothetical protein
MPEQIYKDIALRVIGVLGDPKSSRGVRARNLSYLMSGFTGRKDKAQARAILLKTIDDGHWADPSSTQYWGSFLTSQATPKIQALRGPAKIAALKAAGKLNPELFE